MRIGGRKETRKKLSGELDQSDRRHGHFYMRMRGDHCKPNPEVWRGTSFSKQSKLLTVSSLVSVQIHTIVSVQHYQRCTGKSHLSVFWFEFINILQYLENQSTSQDMPYSHFFYSSFPHRYNKKHKICRPEVVFQPDGRYFLGSMMSAIFYIKRWQTSYDTGIASWQCVVHVCHLISKFKL